jgi:hypothetical protein
VSSLAAAQAGLFFFIVWVDSERVALIGLHIRNQPELSSEILRMGAERSIVPRMCDRFGDTERGR